jgi:hypothetical protein
VSADELGRYFPAFLWVLRDFALDLKDAEEGPITSQAYLEQALEAQPDRSTCCVCVCVCVRVRVGGIVFAHTRTC